MSSPPGGRAPVVRIARPHEGFGTRVAGPISGSVRPSLPPAVLRIEWVDGDRRQTLLAHAIAITSTVLLVVASQSFLFGVVFSQNVAGLGDATGPFALLLALASSGLGALHAHLASTRPIRPIGLGIDGLALRGFPTQRRYAWEQIGWTAPRAIEVRSGSHARTIPLTSLQAEALERFLPGRPSAVVDRGRNVAQSLPLPSAGGDPRPPR